MTVAIVGRLRHRVKSKSSAMDAGHLDGDRSPLDRVASGLRPRRSWRRSCLRADGDRERPPPANRRSSTLTVRNQKSDGNGGVVIEWCKPEAGPLKASCTSGKINFGFGFKAHGGEVAVFEHLTVGRRSESFFYNNADLINPIVQIMSHTLTFVKNPGLIPSNRGGFESTVEAIRTGPDF